LFSQNDSEPAPRYTLRYADPAAPVARNVYAIALFDAYVPDVLFAEVLVRPTWTQPTLSAAEVRANTGVPPPPTPTNPADFMVQLYNPDQQVHVAEKTASWGSSSTFTFTMPVYTFRLPSQSTLDRGSNDPAADATTPKLTFVWRKEGALSSNLACYMTGKTTAAAGADTRAGRRKGGREPDIAVALLGDSGRALTIHESNFHRVEMEDHKGLELVLLLSAVAIRDVYNGGRKDPYNLDGATVSLTPPAAHDPRRKKSFPLLVPSIVPPPSISAPPPPVQRPAIPPRASGRRQSYPAAGGGGGGGGGGPVTDPRTQWAIDAETTRLHRAAEAESRAEEARRREREKRDEAEARRLRKKLEAEEKSQRKKREAEVARETERLRREYGDQSALMPPAAAPRPQQLFPPRPQQRQHGQHLGPYGAGGGMGAAASVASFFPGPQPGAAPPLQQPRPRKSFLGLRRASHDGGQRGLNNKKSSLF
jgi:hypothetical protein